MGSRKEMGFPRALGKTKLQLAFERRFLGSKNGVRILDRNPSKGYGWTWMLPASIGLVPRLENPKLPQLIVVGAEKRLTKLILSTGPFAPSPLSSTSNTPVQPRRSAGPS